MSTEATAPVLSDQQQPNDGNVDMRAQRLNRLESFYDGLDSVDSKFDPATRQDFSAAMDMGEDPKETRAQAINKAYLGYMQPASRDLIEQQWPTVRQQMAKRMGIDKPEVSDTELYGAISSNIKQTKLERGMLTDGLQKSRISQLEGNEYSWLASYQAWKSEAEGKPGYDPKKADDYRNIFETSWRETEATAHAVAPVVNAIADEFARAKAGAGGEGKPSEDFSFGSLLRDRPLVEMLQNLPQGVSADDVLSLASHKAFSKVGGTSQAGTSTNTIDAISRGVSGMERNIADFGTTAMLSTFNSMARNGDEPITPEEEASLKADQKRAVETQRLKNHLNDTFTSGINGLGGPVSHYLYKTVEMLPTIGVMASPEIGVPLLSASFIGQAKQRLLERGASLSQANTVGTLEGLAETATMYLTSNMVTGGLPLKMASLPAAKTAGELALRIGKIGAVEGAGITGITAAQQFTPVLIEHIAGGLSKNFPEVDWTKEFKGFTHSLPETFITLAPLVLLGTGVASFREASKWRDYVGNVDHLESVGLSPEQANRVASIENPDQQIAAFREAFKDKPEISSTSESKLAMIRSAIATPGITYQYNVWDREMVGPTGSRTMQVDIVPPEGHIKSDIGLGSTNLRLLRELGVDAPDVPENLPPGRYTLAEVKDAIANQPMATAARVADGSWQIRGPKGDVIDTAYTPEDAQKLVTEINKTDPIARSADPLPAAVDESAAPVSRGLGITAPGVDKLIDTWRSLSKTRRAFMAHVNRIGGKNEVSREYQAQENKATIFARQSAVAIDESLARAMGRKNTAASIDREALTFVRESQDSKATLSKWRDDLDAVRDPKNADAVFEAKQAIDHALANFERLVPVSKQYAETLDKHLRQQRDMGITVGERSGYVPHWQDIDTGILNIFDSGGGAGVSGGYKHARSFDTYFDSIMAGVNPKTIDALTLLERRLTSGQRSINRQLWATAARNVVDPTTGMPVVTDMETKTREVEGKTLPDIVPPLGYVPMQVGGRTIAVQGGYDGLFRALQDPGAFQNSARGKTLMKGVQLSKSVALFFDTFHLGRIAMHQIVLRGNTSYSKGLFMLDHSMDEMVRKIDAGEVGKIEPELRLEMIETKRKLDLLVDKGLNVATAFENLNADWIHKLNILGTGHYNKWLFEKFQRGGMVQTGLIELERMKKMLPDVPEADVAKRVADDINTRFGNLGAQSWIKSKTLRDLARVLFLAPGWNEGLLRSELGALLEAGETAKAAVMEQRLVSGTLLRNVGGLIVAQFAANQVINYLTRGKPTWENEEEGVGAKMSAWIPDAAGGPGFFLNPFSLPAEITHTIMSKIERGESTFGAVRGLVENKLSGFGRALMVAATQKNRYPDSGLASFLKSLGYDPELPHQIHSSAQMAKSIANSIIPVPIPTTPITKGIESMRSGEVTQNRPGEIQSQIMQSFGVKTESAPSSTQRIQRLASEFKREREIRQDTEPGDSDYSDVKHALSVGNKRDLNEALQTLLTKRTPAEVSRYFRGLAKQSFTGSQKHEAEFVATLSPEQLSTYEKAKADRLELSSRGLDALSDAVEKIAASKN